MNIVSDSAKVNNGSDNSNSEVVNKNSDNRNSEIVSKNKDLDSSKNKNKLTISTINTRGLSNAKVHELEELIENENYILCITETQMKHLKVNFSPQMEILNQMREIDEPFMLAVEEPEPPQKRKRGTSKIPSLGKV